MTQRLVSTSMGVSAVKSTQKQNDDQNLELNGWIEEIESLLIGSRWMYNYYIYLVNICDNNSQI